jgi:hypothetical protein
MGLCGVQGRDFNPRARDYESREVSRLLNPAVRSAGLEPALQPSEGCILSFGRRAQFYNTLEDLS